MRNLSTTGAAVEGIIGVPVGTGLVLDLGEGQLVVGCVRRSQDATQGIEFESSLISDGADGLCTRHRVSPYALAAAGMPLRSLPAGYAASLPQPVGEVSIPRFMQLDLSAHPSKAA